MKIEGWITTDPDNFQFRKEGTDKNVFTFREFDIKNYNLDDELNNFYQGNKEKFLSEYWKNPTFWVESTINLEQYSKEEAWGHASGYYPKDEFEKMWVTDRDIIAECIFEQESSLNY